MTSYVDRENYTDRELNELDRYKECGCPAGRKTDAKTVQASECEHDAPPASLATEMRNYRREIAADTARTALEEISASADYVGLGSSPVVKSGQATWYACRLGQLESVVGQLLAVIEASE